MTKAERAYADKVARLGCVLCLRLGFEGTPAELHHPRTGVGAGRRAPDSEVIPLCPEHHRGRTGVHGMGRRGFEAHYGVTELDLVAETKRLVGDLWAA